MIKLNVTDRRILEILDANSRSSYNEIAKAIRSIPETVRYRVQKLINEGLVYKFYTVIDTGKLGYALYKTFFKLQGVNRKEFEKIIKYLNTQKIVVWIVRFEGKYDLGLTLRCENLRDVKDFLDSLGNKFPNVIQERTFGINIFSQYLPRGYLYSEKKSLTNLKGYSSDSKRVKIDSLGEIVLSTLAENSRVTCKEISTIVNNSKKYLGTITPEAISKRIAKYEKEEVISGYGIVLNHSLIGQLQYKILIYLNSIEEKKLKEFIKFSSSHLRVQYIIRVLSPWDYEITLEVENIKQLREFKEALQDKFSKLVKNIDILQITDYFKYNLVSL